MFKLSNVLGGSLTSIWFLILYSAHSSNREALPSSIRYLRVSGNFCERILRLPYLCRKMSSSTLKRFPTEYLHSSYLESVNKFILCCQIETDCTLRQIKLCMCIWWVTLPHQLRLMISLPISFQGSTAAFQDSSLITASFLAFAIGIPTRSSYIS